MNTKEKIWIGVIVVCIVLSGLFYHFNEKTLKSRAEMDEFMAKMEKIDAKTKKIAEELHIDLNTNAKEIAKTDETKK